MNRPLTAKQADALGKLLASEIRSATSSGRLPVCERLPAAMGRRLVVLGLAEHAEERQERGFGPFDVIFRGYILTHAGRMAYGEWAERQPETAEAEGRR